MNSPSAPRSSIGIMQRTALLSWLVTVMTLGVFIVFIVPQQQRTFVESLESKAHGVAVSLRDVAAGAAINEDYSSVVDHSMEMLRGDPALVYIVITRNDGFSLISDREGWRAEMDSGPEWHPERRVPSGNIGEVSLSPERIYHYSQPFDYSAIEWGWIHVGLSLDTYKSNVNNLYQTTAIVTLVCLVLSLIASVIYAKRLVQPILALRKVVDRVAHGELRVRATIHRSDEIGSLSGSVNDMTASLERRDRIVGSVRRSAELFLRADSWEGTIPAVLHELAEATGVDRASVFVFTDLTPGAERSVRQYHWQRDDIPPESDAAHPEHPVYHPRETPFGDWMDSLLTGEGIAARAEDVSEDKRAVFTATHVKATILLPIMVSGEVWGTLNLDDCRVARRWEVAEQNSLRSAADMLGATIARQHAQDALLEANNTLEQRVTERTQELVAAQQQLINASRQAGMAEIATGVLHNVGNVLNSVNVSSSLVNDRVRESKLRSLVRLADLLKEHQNDFEHFVSNDPRGKHLPEFIIQIAANLANEREFVLNEHEQLTRNIEHIRDIVATQQNYAKVSGFLQQVQLSEIIKDSLQIHTAAFERHQIELIRDFHTDPIVVVDKHKVLQILVNLFQNARYALTEIEAGDRKIIARVEQPDPDTVRISVIDNGVGIPPENLTRIFSHGFTTRAKGHGFGLHSGANFANEMGGSLTATSDGPGHGATFTLELPIRPPE
ncbi:ATP-binding protein [Actomonas aquatica]|uniref:histidine kinase n=1 Tax=Actomonas aquatica TaxID=2866162 RepID=A0ABZ1C9S6_9BACT|nr:ATP-binding protein [Opitutus sp. WL0086]WRQ87339.1 ATP-binding protein [Opitutus sp. WL0086]